MNWTQEAYYYDESGKEFAINKETSKDIVEKYLNQNDLKEIDFNPKQEAKYTFRVKTKKGNWLIFHYGQQELLFTGEYKPEFPSELLNYWDLLIGEKGKKKIIISDSGQKLNEEFWFENYKLIEVHDTIFKADRKNEVHQINKYLLLASQKKDKWAISYIHPFEGETIFKIVPYQAQEMSDLPLDLIKREFTVNTNLSRNYYLNDLLYINEILNNENIQRVELIYNERGELKIRFQRKKDQWGLFWNNEKVLWKKGYSLNFFNGNCGDLILASKRDKKYLYTIGEGSKTINKNLWFTKVQEHTSEENQLILEPVFDDEDGSLIDEKMVSDTFSRCDYLMFKREGKWAIGFYNNNLQEPYQLSGFHFDELKDLPDSTIENYIFYNGPNNITYKEDAMKGAQTLLDKNSDIDVIHYLGEVKLQNFGYRHLYQVRNVKTNRWSYQFLGGFPSSTELPIAATRIKAYKNLGQIGVIETWCDDYVGYYFYDGENIKMIKGCKFDDFQYVFLDATYGCALKKNGKWELYKIDAPEKLVEGNAKTIDGLIELWLNR